MNSTSIEKSIIPGPTNGPDMNMTSSIVMVELEKANQDLVLPDSPTQAVGGLILDGFENISTKHRFIVFKMLSHVKN